MALPPPPTIPIALQSALEDHLGPFTAHPVQGGSSAYNSLAFVLTPLAQSTSTGSASQAGERAASTNPFRAGGTGTSWTNPFLPSPSAAPAYRPPEGQQEAGQQEGQEEGQASYILKIPQNPYSRLAVQRESENLPKLHAYISRSFSPSEALQVPFPAAIPPLPLGALLTHRIPGIDGARAWYASTSRKERESLCRAFGKAARWVHSFALPPASGLPGPLRTTLPKGVAEDVRTPSIDEDPQTTRDWLRLYLRAESARLAPRFTALVPEPEPPITSGREEVLEGPELKRKERELERAVWCVTTIERAVADPDPKLWGEGRERLVVVHGDWTLPNILVRRVRTDTTDAGRAEAAEGVIGEDADGDGEGEWEPVGIVDWGDCGVADRRYDLRMGIWSILYNYALSHADPSTSATTSAPSAREAATSGSSTSEREAEEQESYIRAFLSSYISSGSGPEGVEWVLEDWERWLAAKKGETGGAQGGTLAGGAGEVREGYWEPWAAAYEVWDLLVEDGEVFGPPGLAVE